MRSSRQAVSCFLDGGLFFALAEFLDIWHSLKVPDEVDLLSQLKSGTLCFCTATLTVDFVLTTCVEGLQATSSETVVPKAPAAKKKGKKGGAPRQRPVRITNTHLKGELDLQQPYSLHTNQK